ncbi:MAG: glycine--tRNA ligase subunit beta [Pseudomonadales bacterium]|jgi:glycyl-tRNA synthetase beta chain|nr:glycine--tRNA ligase subunit beta [Pseudomonadales bacterium]MCP5331817.1 glycine--tRNA ligase subunit beta [Pseudomonadales bacterium]HMU89243.1 glycine--tRNA ligase subunit beta [Pseudomonadales bacterium]HMW82361.1 glycine--tRNA ligase subunit beta [Pseudomonadales bacterium]HMY95969.1 glycine--tRNA ligase subunit beta [Pseudomonadales bacterium]
MAEADFLLEIGTEELPPKALPALMQALADLVAAGLRQAALSHGQIEPFATPRRLAVRVRALATRQPDRIEERRGPALSAAFDASGAATPAALGFARSAGVSVEQLERLETDKGVWLVQRRQIEGAATAELLPDLLNQALAQLPVPKKMRWGSSRVEFVRPVHWVVMLLGDQVVPGTLLGVEAGNLSHGHRFHAPGAIALSHPEHYPALLRQQGWVIVDFAERRERIRQLVEAEAARIGARAEIDPLLLDEVTALVEWPVALLGNFDPLFLDVPMEVLISSMKAHQKYFHLVDRSGRLLPHFITLSNLQSSDPAQVIAGNERVIRPRLADARFFYDNDRKQPLDGWRAPQREIIFHNQLGTLHDKSERLARLAAIIAGTLGADAALARRAGELAKCDLLSAMVGEFPELQGTMGRYYARHSGEPEVVAIALEEQYRPRFAGDALPTTPVGSALALAEKLDTLVGLFGIGQPPTGTRDPFALRRAALGTLRILVEGRHDLDLPALLEAARDGYPTLPQHATVVPELYRYLLERFRAWYQDEGIGSDVISAVLARPNANPHDIHLRLLAVNHFVTLESAAALASANKRVANLLNKQEGQTEGAIDSALLVDAAEQQLAAAMATKSAALTPLLTARDYSQALTLLAGLRPQIDAFFDQVMVMVEDEALRNNRLRLLAALRALFVQIADISELRSGGK